MAKTKRDRLRRSRRHRSTHEERDADVNTRYGMGRAHFETKEMFKPLILLGPTIESFDTNALPNLHSKGRSPAEKVFHLIAKVLIEALKHHQVQRDRHQQIYVRIDFSIQKQADLFSKDEQNERNARGHFFLLLRIR